MNYSKSLILYVCVHNRTFDFDKRLLEISSSKTGTILPRLFFGKPKTLPPIVVTLITLSVKKAGLNLKNLETSAAEKYKSLLHASYELIFAVTGETDFPTNDHLWAGKEYRWDRKKYQDDANGMKFRGIIHDKGDFEKLLFLCSKCMAFWWIIWDTMVTSTVLAATDYCDSYLHMITLTPLAFK